MKDKTSSLAYIPAYIIIAVVAFIFMIPHSMAPWGNGNYPTDVCVYYRCAEWIDQGLVMYRDMFDHKGPLVYATYWFVTRFAGLYGIWALDVFLTFAILLVFFNIARIYTTQKNSLYITLLVGMYFQLPFLDEGGPEWLATLGCSYTVYLFAKHLEDKEYCSFGEMYLLATSVAICLFTKFNTSAGIIPVSVYFLYHLIYHFDTRIFIRYCAAVVLGLASGFIPILCWLHYTGNMLDFIEAYLFFNTHEYGNEFAISRGTAILNVTLVCIPAYLFYIIFVWYDHQEIKKTLWISLAFVIPTLLNGYIKNGYPHYLFPCFAVYALPLAKAWNNLSKNKILYHITIVLCIIVGIVTFGVRSYLRVGTFDNSHDIEVATFLNKNRGNSEYVMVYGFKDRTMWAFNNPAYSFNYRLWLLLEGKPASKFFYMPPGMPPEWAEQSLQTICKHSPHWIVAHQQNSIDIINLGYSVYSCDEAGYQILHKQ